MIEESSKQLIDLGYRCNLFEYFPNILNLQFLSSEEYCVLNAIKSIKSVELSLLDSKGTSISKMGFQIRKTGKLTSLTLDSSDSSAIKFNIEFEIEELVRNS